jgi:hypothetical protein
LLYRSFSKALPPDQVERLAREAIYEYGRIKGQRDGRKITPEAWVDKHVSKGSARCELIKSWDNMDSRGKASEALLHISV